MSLLIKRKHFSAFLHQLNGFSAHAHVFCVCAPAPRALLDENVFVTVPHVFCFLFTLTLFFFHFARFSHQSMLNTTSGRLTFAIVAIKALQRTSQLQTRTIKRKRIIPLNKYSENQPRFFFNKKTRPSPQTGKLSKPLITEVQEKTSTVLHQATTWCGIWLEEDDNSFNLMNWLQWFLL